MAGKALVENKPALGMNREICLGASVEQMKRVLEETGLGFCFDLGHAICYAAFAEKPWEHVVDQFLALDPSMFHVCDGRYASTDVHLHFGGGDLDLAAIVKRMPADARVTIETPKDSLEHLDDFVEDVAVFRRFAGH